VLHPFGKLNYDAKAAGTTANTMYDIASLTKVVATTTLVAKLAEGDFAVPLDLDAKIERICRNGRAGRTRSGGTE